jgi:hypothetical protein
MSDKFDAFFKLAGDIRDGLDRCDGPVSAAITTKLRELKRRWDAGDIADFIGDWPMNWEDEWQELFPRRDWGKLEALFYPHRRNRAKAPAKFALTR